jgi:hypothetical protein
MDSSFSMDKARIHYQTREIISDQDRLGDVFIDIAATQRDITENARLLFPD